MAIGLIGAMDEELEVLLKETEVEKVEMKASMKFIKGYLYGKEVVVVRCGIGKVNSAICAQILADDFKVDYVINVGIAGGIGADVKPGDVVIGDSLVQHDVDAVAFGYDVGQIPRVDTLDFKSSEYLVKLAKDACKDVITHNYFVGRIATGDQFVADINKTTWLKEKFNAIACEMEGGSIAQTCYLNQIPFVVLRSISDNADNGAHMDYDKFQHIAIKNSTEIIKNMLLKM